MDHGFECIRACAVVGVRLLEICLGRPEVGRAVPIWIEAGGRDREANTDIRMAAIDQNFKTWHLRYVLHYRSMSNKLHVVTSRAPKELTYLFFSSFYREAVEAAVNYNSQLLQDRSTRLPYLDAQTGIAQTTSPLLRSRLERRRGEAPGQLFSYPPRRWRQESKPLPLFKKGEQ